MTVILILFFLLTLEEIFHRLNRESSFTDIVFTDNLVEQTEQKGTGRFSRLLSWIRALQLLVFGLLFAVIAALSGIRVLNTAAGQIAGLLLLIQVVRILNRKVINQWSVLGITVILQVFLLILLIFSGLSPVPSFQTDASEADWFVSIISFAVLFMLSITMPFTVSYYMRLFSREGSGLYYFLPSLAYSEYWIRRLSRMSANTALASLLMFVFLIARYGSSVEIAVLHVVLVFFLFTSRVLFRNRLKLHHPAAVFLVLFSWIIGILWVFTGFASVSSSWSV